MVRLCVLLILVTLAAPAGHLTAQLRPDPAALKTAEAMKARRATAVDVAGELLKMRSSPAQITAVMRAVGFEAASITEAHTRVLRLDAGSSGKAWQEATGDATLAFAALMELTRSDQDALRLARADLNLDARASLRAMMYTRQAEKADRERAYADMKAGGYSQTEIVEALVSELGTSASEVFDAMKAQGASLVEIAHELSESLGQSAAQIRELFQDRNVDSEEGAEALDAIGSPMDALLLIFLTAQLEGQQDAQMWLALAEKAQPFVESSSQAVEWLSGHMTGLALASAGFAFVLAEHGSIQAAVAAGATAQAVEFLVAAGVTLADALHVMEVVGAGDEAIGSAAHFLLGNADATWTLLGETLGWSADRIESALAEIVPVTIGYLANYLALGGVPERTAKIIERLRDVGVSAVDVAMEVGTSMGVLPMAQALWDAGYGAAEVTGGLVQGMQVSAGEAAQVVAGLAGGT